MTPAKEIDGELWVKASDMQMAVSEAVKAEREACAKVCEDEGERIDASWMSCAAAIRSRT